MQPLAQPAGASGPAPIRAIVIDDSAVIRGLVTRWLSAAGIEMVGSFRTGREAVDNAAAAAPEVAVLDIEMPEMDGLTALPLLLQRCPRLKVIVASTLTSRGAEATLRALSLGAADYLPKPGLAEGGSTSDVFRQELLAKVQSLAGRRAAEHAVAPRGPKDWVPVAPQSMAALRPSPAQPARASLAPQAPAPGEPATRAMPQLAPSMVVIGSSTGGPHALMTLVGALGQKLARVPVLITQHMPPLFTPVLAQHLARSSGLPAGEGEDGETLRPGRIYVAPGGRHMRVVRGGAELRIALDDGPPINFCRPSVDPLFASVAALAGSRALGLMLTGMGSDGLDGSRSLVEAGGALIAQDEASSVVWGMPGAVARAGLCSAVVSLDRMAELVSTLLTGKPR